jgi:hypothetical protein
LPFAATQIPLFRGRDQRASDDAKGPGDELHRGRGGEAPESSFSQGKRCAREAEAAPDEPLLSSGTRLSPREPDDENRAWRRVTVDWERCPRNRPYWLPWRF